MTVLRAVFALRSDASIHGCKAVQRAFPPSQRRWCSAKPTVVAPQVSHPHIKGAAVGVTTGLLGSMAGIGGGPFCVPLLATVASLPHAFCVGTSLVCATTTLVIGGMATVAYATVHISVAPAVVLGVVAPVFSMVGVRFAKKVDEKVMKRAFALFLILSSCSVFAKVLNPGDGERGAVAEWVNSSFSTSCGFYAGVAVVAGLASGTLGLGGGSVVVPLLSIADVASWQEITGTALISMIPTSIVSLSGHLSHGTVVRPLCPSLIVGTCVGAVLGPLTLSYMEETTRKTVCACIIGATGLYMLML